MALAGLFKAPRLGATTPLAFAFALTTGLARPTPLAAGLILAFGGHQPQKWRLFLFLHALNSAKICCCFLFFTPLFSGFGLPS